MVGCEVALTAIAPDEDFRVSEDLSSPRLLASLRAVGQLDPVILWRRAGMLVTLCGFRRLAALRQLGCAMVAARILEEADIDAVAALTLALHDNLAQREFAPLEQARALAKLRDLGVGRDSLVADYLPLLGLPARAGALDAALALVGAHPRLRRQLTAGLLTPATVERLAALDYDGQERFSLLLEHIRLSASSQKKLLDLLEDLAGPNGVPLTAPLELPAVATVVATIGDDTKLSPSQKGERLYDALYRVAQPSLTAARERFAAQRKQLRLPGAIGLESHPYFETTDITVRFQAASAAQFRELAGALWRAAQSVTVEKLFS